jgi:hypothetical protein
VRAAGVAVGLEGVGALVAALILVIRGLAGADQRVVSGFGTAIWFLVVGAGMLGAGWALWTGRRWGRGVAVVAQLLLLPFAWYMGVGSHRLVFGIPVAVIALGTLALLFSPPTLRWVSGYGSASSNSADPETR